MLSVYVMGVVVTFSNQENIFIVIVFQKFAIQINEKVEILWKEGLSKKTWRNPPYSYRLYYMPFKIFSPFLILKEPFLPN